MTRRAGALAVAALTACAPTWTTSMSDRVVDRKESIEIGGTQLDAQRHGDTIDVVVFQERQCVTTRVREHVATTSADPAGGWLLNGLVYGLGGTIAIIGIAGTVSYLAEADSSWPLAAAISVDVSGLGLLGLAAGNHIRSRVPSKVETSREPEEKRRRCSGGLAGVEVRASGRGGAVLASGTTGEDGRVSLTSDKKGWRTSAITVETAGAPAVTVPAP